MYLPKTNSKAFIFSFHIYIYYTIKQKNAKMRFKIDISGQIVLFLSFF